MQLTCYRTLLKLYDKMMWVETDSSPTDSLPNFEKFIHRPKVESVRDNYDIFPLEDTPTEYFDSKSKDLQRVLRSQLQQVGLNPGWMLNTGASLHAQAIYSLAAHLEKASNEASISSWLKNQATAELALLATTLESIFTQHIKLTFREEPNGIYCFSGYSDKLTVAPKKRITISQRLEDYCNPNTKK